jgi:hypothetical protein
MPFLSQFCLEKGDVFGAVNVKEAQIPGQETTNLEVVVELKELFDILRYRLDD